jgi:hypothetical protein
MRPPPFSSSQDLLPNANLDVKNIQCQTGQARAHFGTCLDVDASTQLVCPAGAAPKALSCISLDGASQVCSNSSSK